MKSEHWWNRLSAASSLFSHTSLPLLLIVLRLFPRTVPLRLLDGLPRRFYCKMAAHLPLTHRSFSKLLNGSVKLMPFSLFGLISIRVWQIPMRQFEFLQFIPMFLTFHLGGDAGGFPALQQPWSCFSALLEGFFTVMFDTSHLTDAYQMGLHLPVGTRNWTSNVSVLCFPLSLPANQIETDISNFLLTSSSTFLLCFLHHCNNYKIVIRHLWFL